MTMLKVIWIYTEIYCYGRILNCWRW